MDEAPSEKKRLRYSREQIQEILTAYEASGLSQRKFCQQRGLSLASFGNWRRAGSLLRRAFARCT